MGNLDSLTPFCDEIIQTLFASVVNKSAERRVTLCILDRVAYMPGISGRELAKHGELITEALLTLLRAQATKTRHADADALDYQLRAACLEASTALMYGTREAGVDADFFIHAHVQPVLRYVEGFAREAHTPDQLVVACGRYLSHLTGYGGAVRPLLDTAFRQLSERANTLSCLQSVAQASAAPRATTSRPISVARSTLSDKWRSR